LVVMVVVAICGDLWRWRRRRRSMAKFGGRLRRPHTYVEDVIPDVRQTKDLAQTHDARRTDEDPLDARQTKVSLSTIALYAASLPPADVVVLVQPAQHSYHLNFLLSTLHRPPPSSAVIGTIICNP